MSWRVVVRPEIEQDLADAADWYNSREDGLGDGFIGRPANRALKNASITL